MKKLLLAFITPLLLGGCSLQGAAQSDHACSDKVVQEVTTDTTVHGLWACLSHDFQNTLNSNGGGGTDGVFTDPSLANQMPPVTVQYMGRSDGVDVYAVKVSIPGSADTTRIFMVWVNNQGLIDNIGIGKPIF